MQNIFSMIAKLEKLKGQKNAGELSEEEKKDLNGQLRNLHSELARRGYTSEQQERPGILTAWAVYVEMGPDTLCELIEAATAAKDKTEGEELERLDKLKCKIGIDNIPFSLEEAEIVLKIINDRPTAVAARYMVLDGRPELTSKEKNEKDALTARLGQLGIPANGRDPIEQATILANKGRIQRLLDNLHLQKSRKVIARYTNAMRATDLREAFKTPDNDDEFMIMGATSKGTRARRSRDLKRTRARKGALEAFNRELQSMGLTDTDPDALQRAINDFKSAQHKRNDQRRKCRAESRTVADEAVDPGVTITMADSDLMRKNPGWRAIVDNPTLLTMADSDLMRKNPGWRAIVDNPTLRALAAEDM